MVWRSSWNETRSGIRPNSVRGPETVSWRREPGFQRTPCERELPAHEVRAQTGQRDPPRAHSSKRRRHPSKHPRSPPVVRRSPHGSREKRSFRGEARTDGRARLGRGRESNRSRGAPSPGGGCGWRWRRRPGRSRIRRSGSSRRRAKAIGRSERRSPPSSRDAGRSRGGRSSGSRPPPW